MSETVTKTVPVCVCVYAAEECSAQNDERSESQDGGPMAPRGRGLRPRLSAYTTTTIYTLGLVSSSIARESNLKVILARAAGGGVHA